MRILAWLRRECGVEFTLSPENGWLDEREFCTLPKGHDFWHVSQNQTMFGPAIAKYCGECRVEWEPTDNPSIRQCPECFGTTTSLEGMNVADIKGIFAGSELSIDVNLKEEGP